MKLKKGVKRFLVILLVIILIGLLLYGGYIGYKKYKQLSNNKEVEIVNQIKDYNYVLDKDDPKKYKDYFEQLDKVLKAKEVDEEAYAKLVAQMLVFDFYNLNDKMSKNDIGGVQFIIDKYRDNFTLEAGETVYKYIEHNVYGDRKQELPEVIDVVSSDVRTSYYKYGDISDDKAYVVKVNVTYKKDLGYPKTVTVKMIHTKINAEKSKLEVFYMK